MEAAYNNTDTATASFPLLGQKTTVLTYQLIFYNHNNTFPFFLSYIIHVNAPKMIIITREEVVMPLPAQV